MATPLAFDPDLVTLGLEVVATSFLAIEMGRKTENIHIFLFGKFKQIISIISNYGHSKFLLIRLSLELLIVR